MIFNSPPEKLISRRQISRGCADKGLHAWPALPFVSDERQSMCHVQTLQGPLHSVSESHLVLPLSVLFGALGPSRKSTAVASQLTPQTPGPSCIDPPWS